MSRAEVLSTCTMQLKSGSFCDAPADLRFPNRICTDHAIKVFLSVKEQIPAAIADLTSSSGDHDILTDL